MFSLYIHGIKLEINSNYDTVFVNYGRDSYVLPKSVASVRKIMYYYDLDEKYLPQIELINDIIEVEIVDL